MNLCCLPSILLGGAFFALVAMPLSAQPVTVAVTSLPATPAQYRATLAQVEANLQTDVLGAWFPRAVSAKGGFDQNFSENWTNTSHGERSIVFQSRLTWLAAQAALRYPAKKAEWSAISTHGADFLRAAMWDAQNGGFFWALEGGIPVRDGEKHAYGNAFAIYALAANYRATQNPRALALAQEAFRWLDLHAHDAQNGGYFEALDRSGRPILAPVSDAQTADVIGTRYGFKSMNSHIHLLEALAALHEVWPDKVVESRLREVFGLVRNTIVVPDVGAMNLFFTPAWKPVPNDDSYGHDIETAYLLVEAAAALGMPDDAQTWKVARQLVDHTLDFGHDAENGGFYDAGGAFGGVSKPEKIWWTQAEALNALLLMHQKYGAQTSRYFDAFNAQWNFIRTRQVDALNGGWYPSLTREGATIPGHVKSDGWTEGYHQGRALLNVAAMLQKLAAK